MAVSNGHPKYTHRAKIWRWGCVGSVRMYERTDQIWAGLRFLSERQRAALVLRFFEDLSDEQTAAALGCRVGTVRSLISRGLAVLRTQMSEVGRHG